MVGGLAVRVWGDPAEPGIVLWPGLGSSGAYFASVAGALPGRGVAVDPPGCGRTVPLDPCTCERLVEMTRGVVEACGCRAIVGHSLGAYVAIGVAAKPPVGLRAAVLIDGGFLDADGFAELGMPTTQGRAELSAWLEANAPRFPSWDTAIRKLAIMVGTEATPALEAYVRQVFAEVDGEIRERARPDRMADLLLAVLEEDVHARAQRVRVPTLLIACGQPPERRATREKAWQRLAQASPLIELHVADDWGHNPILQDAEVSSSVIADWLRAHL
jgi:pimeloyl-ACP methyl ester carboxylesterase